MTLPLFILLTIFHLVVPQIQVDITPSHKTNSFVPEIALASSMDFIPSDQVEWVYSQPIVEQSLSAGWGTISYRQHTEQTICVWHWNPVGTWSNPESNSGYFTGSPELGSLIRNSYGYTLPHRGNTWNAGTEWGYSFITDGNMKTYWKSNPYLTKKYTGDDDSLHPQWVVVQLSKMENINALKIDWADPYARDYRVDYWTGPDAINDPANGIWKLFTNGIIQDGTGGTVLLNLSATPVSVQFVRIWMTRSSSTCDTHGSDDIRNCVGYAINELYGGVFDATGAFVDIFEHHTSYKTQTMTYCSSIDPWHSASDITTDEVQTGFDIFFTSGYTRNLPAIIPVSVLYGTPEDSANQIAYLIKRGYPFSYVEVGEEPDGQYILPEDYAELYLQWATAIHRVDPNVKLGGPVFTGENTDIKIWPDEKGRTSWMGRFVDYLRVRGRIQDLAFISFEHYPYNPCTFTWQNLYDEPKLMTGIIQVWKDDGVPDVPFIISESGLSFAVTKLMDEMFGAIWLADSVGSFLGAGGDIIVHSPVQPEIFGRSCDGYGTEANFIVHDDRVIAQYTCAYHTGRMINFDWVTHGSGTHDMYPALSNITDNIGNILVMVYAVRCPNEEWSLLIVNRDQNNSHTVNVTFNDADNNLTGYFLGPTKMVSFSNEQYVWIDSGPTSHADPDLPPVRSMVKGGEGMLYTLPKASINVLRGVIQMKKPPI